MSESNINAPKFSAVLHYDSSISDHLTYRIRARTYLKCCVTFLRFTLPGDSVYADPTAYLHITGSIERPSLSVNQIGKKREGFLLPICNPGASNEIRFAPTGLLLEEGELQFKILDKNLNEVVTNRIIVTINVLDADTK